MPTNAATEAQMVSPEEQVKNAELIRNFFSSAHGEGADRYTKYIASDARIWSDSRPSDNPVVWRNDEVLIGPEGMKKMGEAYADRGFSYDMDIHTIYVAGPVVVVTRTDVRKQAGQPDKPIPAVGVFAVKDGKIVEWSDYYR